ncbi:FtsW/RodA/SpoVE family cell cycle protein [Lentisphaerota bacterium WC36G]|nr:FtsW/RodA/SpoVE family cell cycle protein [Lentisphaerae bacterium WC36]
MNTVTQQLDKIAQLVTSHEGKLQFSSKKNHIIVIYAMLLILGLCGCLAIYSATFSSSSPKFFVIKQFLWLVAGLLTLWCSSIIKFKYYLKLILPIIGIFYALLILVLIRGHQVNGMNGWFEIPVKLFSFKCYFQPSEVAKAFFVLFLAKYLLNFKNDFKNFCSFSIVAVLWSVPIMLQPDLGTLLIYAIAMLFYFVTQVKRWQYILLWSLPLIVALMWIFFNHSYITERLLGFLYPEADPLNSGWHINQFRYTIARGGLTGASWGNAIWANNFLPLAHSDSAYASISEACGFTGMFIVCLSLASLSYCGFYLAEYTQNLVARRFILGATIIFSTQTLLHMAVNLTIFPTTGITLPILSYGGSSMIATMLLFGIMISAAKCENTANNNNLK